MTTKQATQVEAKVTNTTAVSGLIGILMAVLYNVQGNPGELGFLPVWAQSIVIALLPGVIVLVTGYLTPHTTRTDVGVGVQGVAADEVAQTAAYNDPAAGLEA